MVIARRGTFSSPKKSEAASTRVMLSSVISRVTLVRADLHPCLILSYGMPSLQVHLQCDAIRQGCGDLSSKLYVPLLVETNVTCASKAQQLQVYTASGLDGSFICSTVPAPVQHCHAIYSSRLLILFLRTRQLDNVRKPYTPGNIFNCEGTVRNVDVGWLYICAA